MMAMALSADAVKPRTLGEYRELLESRPEEIREDSSPWE